MIQIFVNIPNTKEKRAKLWLMLFENDGKGKFTMHLTDKGHESHLGTRLTDLDSDGDLDLVSTAWDNYKFLHVWRNDAIQNEIKWTHLHQLPVIYLHQMVAMNKLHVWWLTLIKTGLKILFLLTAV